MPTNCLYRLSCRDSLQLHRYIVLLCLRNDLGAFPLLASLGAFRFMFAILGDLDTFVGTSWATLGCLGVTLGLLGILWEPLGAVWGRSWGVLGAAPGSGPPRACLEVYFKLS